MAIRFTGKNTFTVQVQRGGARKTKRGTGTEADAKRIEAALTADLEREQKLDQAADLLGIERGGEEHAKVSRAPTLRAFFEDRWVAHALVVQNATTRRAQITAFRYLVYYLGDKRLDELTRPSEINAFVEAMKTNGQITFKRRLDGQMTAKKVSELKHETINKCLSCLKALLNLAHAEQVITVQPKIGMLPKDDSTPVLPPTEEELVLLLDACEHYRPRAPLLPEVVVFAAETGLRRGELFHLTWRSVDLERSAIRIETQGKSRLINGQIWKPKHNKWREVPLSLKAQAIVERLRASGPHGPEDAVFPNRGGSPYDRSEGAPPGAGHGWFPDAAEAAGLKGKCTFHSLRHLFAVRLLTGGVPITVVSELLGHSHIQITVKRYGRYASDAQVKFDAVRVLDAPAPPPPPAPRPPPPRNGASRRPQA